MSAAASSSVGSPRPIPLPQREDLCEAVFNSNTPENRASFQEAIRLVRLIPCCMMKFSAAPHVFSNGDEICLRYFPSQAERILQGFKRVFGEAFEERVRKHMVIAEPPKHESNVIGQRPPLDSFPGDERKVPLPDGSGLRNASPVHAERARDVQLNSFIHNAVKYTCQVWNRVFCVIQMRPANDKLVADFRRSIRPVPFIQGEPLKIFNPRNAVPFVKWMRNGGAMLVFHERQKADVFENFKRVFGDAFVIKAGKAVEEAPFIQK